MPESSSDSTLFILIVVLVLALLGIHTASLDTRVRKGFAAIEAKLDALIVVVESRDRM